MILKEPRMLTKLEIWAPRYSSKYSDVGERVALVAKYKVDKATPVILIEFTKAKHLEGQRFAIKRSEIERCILDTNGTIPCYAVPMSKFENWDSVDEIKQIVEELWPVKK